MMRAAFLVLALVSLPAAAVYKWVDEKGVTHYTEEPPPDGKAAAKIETRTVGPGGSTGATDDWKQKELERRKERLERDQAEDYAKRKSEHDAAVRANRCVEARRQLATLERARPVYRMNERGEKVYLDDQDRPRQVEQARALVEKSCDRP